MKLIYFAAIVSVIATIGFAGALHYYDAHMSPPADGAILIDGEAFYPAPHVPTKNCVSTINSTGDYAELCP